jgi:hypothetical protein
MGAGIEQGDLVDARFAVDQTVPGGDGIQSQRADNTDTGDNYAMISVDCGHFFLP